MLERLELRDFAIADRLDVAFEPGFNVLTGETGAGKSIVVDAVSVLVGERPDVAMIRTGRDSALVQGVFRDADIGSAGRRLVRDGRNTARIDGELVAVGELSERAGAHVAIFGQHAAQRLLDAAAQRDQLDRLLDDEGRAAYHAYRDAFTAWQEVTRRLEQLEGSERERARQLDVLRFQVEEIDQARLEPGEDVRLEEEATRLEHAERIVHGVARSVELLGAGDPNVLDLLAAAQRETETAARFHGGLTALAGELSDAVSAVQATMAELEAFLDDFESDPRRLEAIEARIAEIARLERKYGSTIDEILAYRERIGAELADLRAADEDVDALRERRDALAARLDERSRALSTARHRAGAELGRGVADLLPRLALPQARFEAVLEPLDAFGPHGRERVRFLFSANRGEPLAALGDVASGGELSRLMLAIHVVSGTDVPTVVFDEVDAGIGGQTARAVGELLARLAGDRQVLVVTHLPQVAAFASAHFAVTKEEVDGRTVTRVKRLEAAEREAELARMLSGDLTDASLQNARELLETASPRV